jgi:hypothetical protein
MSKNLGGGGLAPQAPPQNPPMNLVYYPEGVHPGSHSIEILPMAPETIDPYLLILYL